MAGCRRAENARSCHTRLRDGEGRMWSQEHLEVDASAVRSRLGRKEPFHHAHLSHSAVAWNGRPKDGAPKSSRWLTAPPTDGPQSSGSRSSRHDIRLGNDSLGPPGDIADCCAVFGREGNDHWEPNNDDRKERSCQLPVLVASGLTSNWSRNKMPICGTATALPTVLKSSPSEYRHFLCYLKAWCHR